MKGAGWSAISSTTMVAMITMVAMGGAPPSEALAPASRMVHVPAGKSDLGLVADLDVDLTEVTRSQFGSCMPCARGGTTFGTDLRTSNLPVGGVSRPQAERYCLELGKRLPTEAEWEWIARGGTKRGGNPWKDSRDACKFAVVQHPIEGDGCGYWDFWPVESLRAGATTQGVLHMAGNVAEWTSSTENELAVVRGGDATSASAAGIFERRLVLPASELPEVGFRCVVNSVLLSSR